MRTSFISTVFNEAQTVRPFLSSLFEQTHLPDEIVIVDAYSTDGTYQILLEERDLFVKKHPDVHFAIIQKKGNRSVGRNEAVKRVRNTFIACSDVGCILDTKWLQIVATQFQNNSQVDVVAGWYEPITKSVFQKALAAYTCVMLDKLNPETFLPSSRSIAFTKAAWEQVGGYPEELDTCEDLVFASRLKRAGLSFAFAKDVVVFWPQRKNIYEAFIQFYQYAVGDGQALYIRPQTYLLFLRYALGFVLLGLFASTQSYILGVGIVIGLVGYCVWSIGKNYQYVRHWKALYLLPVLQITADSAVMSGMIVGMLKKVKNYN